MKFVPAKNFYSGRQRPLNLIVLHSTESSEIDSGAEANAAYFASGTVVASAHIVVDNNSEVRCVKDEDTAFAAPGANANGLQLEMVGRAAQGAAQWSDDYSKAMIGRAVKIVANWCVVHNIPPVFVNASGLKKNQAGITFHAEVTKAFGKSTHTDPGKSFPIKDFLAAVENEIKSLKDVNPVVVPEVKPVAEKPVEKPKTSKIPDFPGSLRIGHRGPEVSKLQEALNTKGFKLDVDGIFGAWTASALRKFAVSVKLPDSNILTVNTWNALFS